MEVDTGALTSVMSQSIFMNTWKGSGPKLQSSDVYVKTYTGESLEVIGSIDVDAKYEGQKASLQLQIINADGHAFLQRDWLHKLKLNWPAIGPLSLKSVLDMHSSVFNEVLGCVQEMSAKIHVEPESTPQFCKARPVPYALRDKVECELDHLHELGVTELVEFVEWATPIVSVVKSDGSVRICRDYKVTVSKVAKVDHYPLPRIEDLFA